MSHTTGEHGEEMGKPRGYSAPTKEECGSDLLAIWQALDRLDGKTGLCLIQRGTYRILHINKKHFEDWGPIEGKACFEAYQLFAEPCPWCPVRDVFSGKGTCHGIALSPHGGGNGMVYSAILATPGKAGADGVPDVALEIIIDVTESFTEEARRRAEAREQLVKLGSLLERVQPKDHIPPFVLLGAVGRRGLRFHSAYLLTLQETARLEPFALVEESYFLKQTRVSADLEEISELGREQVQHLWSRLATITQVSRKCACGIADFLGECGLPSEGLQDLVRGRSAIRLGTAAAAVPIHNTRGRIAALLVCRTSESGGLIWEQDLIDLDYFVSLIEGAVTRQTMQSGAQQELAKLRRTWSRLDARGKSVFTAAHTVLALSHELKTASISLLQVSNPMEIMVRQGMTTSIGDAVRQMKTYVDYISACADQITAMNLLPSPKLYSVPIRGLICEVFEGWSKRLDAEGITWNVQKLENDPKVKGNRFLLRVVFFNLISNSIKWFDKHDRKIDVTFGVEPEYVEVRFTDNGAGIPPEHVGQVFDEFFTTSGDEGSGLGLATVRTFVESIHCGKVEAISKFGEYTQILIRLPRQ